MSKTPAAKGVPYFTNFDDRFSLLNKIRATDKDRSPAAILAKSTTTKSDITIVSHINENNSHYL